MAPNEHGLWSIGEAECVYGCDDLYHDWMEFSGKGSIPGELCGCGGTVVITPARMYTALTF